MAAGIRGWLLVLCAWLTLWLPLNTAVAAAEGLSALPVRGWPLALLLLARFAVTAVGVAAGRALWESRPGAVSLTKAAIVLSGLLQLFVYATAIAPNNRRPGETPYYAAAAVAIHGGWLLYLMRSSRIRSLGQ